MEAELGLRPELVEGSGGVFEVRLDGELLFSKRALDRFPEQGEVEELLRRHLAR